MGDVTFENKTAVGIRGDSKITRRYPIQVLNGDRAAVGVDLKLYNSTSDIIWAGKTDNEGKTDLEVTFYRREFTISRPSPELADTLRLVASDASGEKDVPINFSSDTPVILIFPQEPVKPLWAQGWFMETISVVIASIVVILFVFEKLRWISHKKRLLNKKE